MNPEKNKEVSFNWTPEFSVALAKLMIRYRSEHRPEGSIESAINFERRCARDFEQALRTLMEAHSPALAGDSDIATLVDRMKTAHDGAQAREEKRMRAP